MSFNGFKIKDYKYICETIMNSGYKTYTLHEYLIEKPEYGFIIIRHDVDYNIYDALRISEIESLHGIHSTFYIRLNKKSTKENISKLKSISSEIGLHYDALTKANNDIREALSIFYNQLNYLNSIAEVKTISAHGSSTKIKRNTELLEKINLNQLNLIGDAMLSIDFGNIPYYSDAGRTWNLHKNKLNDYPDKIIKDYSNIDNTYELCSLIKKDYYNGIYISSHPELWAQGRYYDLFKEIKYGRMRFILKSFIKRCNESRRNKLIK